MSELVNEEVPAAKVLYVDDEPNLCRAFLRIFGNEPGLNVHVMTSPAAALDLIDKESFDVIVSDLRMPEMDGIAFLANARRQRPEARRLLISGYADFETALVAINKVGVDRLLTKPWNTYEVVSAVQAAADHVSLLRENARVHEELRRKNKELGRMNRQLDLMLEERTSNLLDSLVSALDLRDSETQWHSRRVGLYARRLASELGIAGKDLDDIERGSILHDIGKIGVRDAVLLKPGPLNDEEWVEMKRHPALGFEMLKDIGFLEHARLIPLQHQERYDGSGYPGGLRGEQISIGARIFAVVDTYDAITSNRPYRKARTYAVARSEIERCANTQFDPKVVSAWLRVPEGDWHAIRQSLEAKGADD
ncbi:MAG: response regulator [Deltaproteobacteria bacterium]|nr:response regulator [Deltaproteobacteria bacterium]